MKKIMFINIMLFLLSSIFTIYAKDILTPEQFLKYNANISTMARTYTADMLLTTGLPILASSTLLENKDNRKNIQLYGGILTGIGLSFKLIPYGTESSYQRYIKNPDISALDMIKELKESQVLLRKTAATLYAVYGLLYAPPKTANNKSDFNTFVKVGSIATSISFLLFKTPLEQACNEIINQEKKNTALFFKPGINQLALGMKVSF